MRSSCMLGMRLSPVAHFTHLKTFQMDRGARGKFELYRVGIDAYRILNLNIILYLLQLDTIQDICNHS
jgi:hypothetical protein